MFRQNKSSSAANAVAAPVAPASQRITHRMDALEKLCAIQQQKIEELEKHLKKVNDKLANHDEQIGGLKEYEGIELGRMFK